MTPPPGLSAAGRLLWAALTDSYAPVTPADELMITEACRISDRLARLDTASRGLGAAWLTFRRARSGEAVTVIVDRVLSEQRASALALKAVLSELRMAHSAAHPAEAPAPAATGPEELPDDVADLTAAIAARRLQGS